MKVVHSGASVPLSHLLRRQPIIIAQTKKLAGEAGRTMTCDREVAMSRQQYLERARECREIAATMKGESKQKLLQVAEAWVMLAREDEEEEIAHKPATAH
jgi:hypothetical protein